MNSKQTAKTFKLRQNSKCKMSVLIIISDNNKRNLRRNNKIPN